jgi:ribonuclease HI
LLFKLYSDAGSFNNGYKDPDLPCFSACAVVIATEDYKILKEGSRLFPDKTISYSELKAALLALDLLKKRIIDRFVLEKPIQIELYSDSQFVISGLTKWLDGWCNRCKGDWRTDVWYNSTGNEVAHYELFREIKLNYIDNPDYDIKFFHIKGHTKNKDFNSQMNDLCDRLCTKKLNEHKKLLNLK